MQPQLCQELTHGTVMCKTQSFYKNSGKHARQPQTVAKMRLLLVSYMPLGHDFCLAQTRRLLGYSSVGRARSRPWKMAEMLPIHDAAINGDLEGLTRELERGVSPDIPFGQGGLVPLQLVITNNFITNDNGVVDLSDLDNRLACIRLPTESARGGRHQKIRARPPQRPRRDVSPKAP